MDPHTDTAEAVMTRHQPNRWWVLLGRNRCRQGCGRWPCNRWHLARDHRDRRLDDEAIRRILAVIRELQRADDAQR